jgi:hypothetical protein
MNPLDMIELHKAEEVVSEKKGEIFKEFNPDIFINTEWNEHSDFNINIENLPESVL